MKRIVLYNVVNLDEFKKVFDAEKPISLYGTTFDEDETQYYMIVEDAALDAAELYLNNEKVKFCIDHSDEIKTLEDIANYINNHEHWEFDVYKAIERNGWTDESREEFGVCSDETHRVSFNENGEAILFELK